MVYFLFIHWLAFISWRWWLLNNTFLYVLTGFTYDQIGCRVLETCASRKKLSRTAKMYEKRTKKSLRRERHEERKREKWIENIHNTRKMCRKFSYWNILFATGTIWYQQKLVILVVAIAFVASNPHVFRFILIHTHTHSHRPLLLHAIRERIHKEFLLFHLSPSLSLSHVLFSLLLSRFLYPFTL